MMSILNINLLRISPNKTNDINNVISIKDKKSNISTNKMDTYQLQKDAGDIKRLLDDTFTKPNQDSKPKIFNETDFYFRKNYDETLDINQRLIHPLFFKDLPINVKNLLERRNCKSFPCHQDIKVEKDIFNSRKKTYIEGCEVINKYLKVRIISPYQKIITPRSRNFRVCALPKVS